jgi:hypothetical protein
VSRIASFLILLSLALCAIGCGGGSKSSNGSGNVVPGVNVLVTSPTGPGALDGNQTLGITVQVTNNGSPDSAGVTWTVAADQKGGPIGTLTDVKATSVTYNPPVGLASPAQVTVTATSVTDPTRSATVPISVYPTPVITTVSSDLAAAYVKTDYTCIEIPYPAGGITQVPCQVVATGGLGPYTWSLGNTALPSDLQLAPGNPNSQPCSNLVNCEEIIGQATTAGVYLFSITATDSLGGTSTAQLTINVAPSQLKVTAPTLLTLVPNEPYAPVQFQASGGTPPYRWSLAPGSGPPPTGITLSPGGVLSGTPTTPQQTSFALQVLDSQSPVPAQAIFPAPQVNASQNIITLNLPSDPTDSGCIGGGGSLQAGTPYAFLFAGFDKDGPVTLSGSFTADDQGNLTGEEDIIRTSGAQSAVPLTAGSSISFNKAHGCLTLNTATSNAQFRVVPTAAEGSPLFDTEGRIVEFDDMNGQGTRGTGVFHIQDSNAFSTSAISGPYAFRFSGWDVAGSRFAMAGTASASSGLITSASADINDGGVLSGALSGGSGTIGSVDANGRGTATLSIGTGTYDLIFYVVDASHLIFNSPHPAMSGHPLITGEATTSAGPFSNATLNNSHIYHFAGTAGGSPDIGVGVLHFDGLGTVSGTAYQRSGGTPTATTISQGYSVDGTTGRFTSLSNGLSVIGYAVAEASGVTGYLLGTGSAAESGVLEFQTDSYPPGYQFSPINGLYGMAVDAMMDSQTTAFSGQGHLNPNGGISIQNSDSFQDSSNPAGLLLFQEFDLFKYTLAADGSGTFGGYTYMVTSGSKFFYIDISPLNAHPAVVVGQFSHE